MPSPLNEHALTKTTFRHTCPIAPPISATNFLATSLFTITDQFLNLHISDVRMEVVYSSETLVPPTKLLGDSPEDHNMKLFAL